MDTIEIIVLKKSDERTYNSITAIKNRLSSHDLISFSSNGNIIYSNDKEQLVDLIFKVTLQENHANRDKVFHIQLDYDSNIEEKFKQNICELTTIIQSMLIEISESTRVSVLKHDVYKEYAIDSYTLIFEVENELRKFVTNLMTSQIGYNWIDEALPEGINPRSANIDTDQSDLLYEIYYSDLINILFEGQREKGLRSIGDIQAFVEKQIKDNEITIEVEKLYGVIKRSLWQKYFASLGDEAMHMENNLKALTPLRNQVAHNRFVDRSTLGKIRSLHQTIMKSLSIATGNITSIKFTEDEKKNSLDIISQTRNYYSATQTVAIDNYIEKLGKSISSVSKFMGAIQFFDAVYLLKTGQRVGVKVVDYINDFESSKNLADQMIKELVKDSLHKATLLVASYTTVSNLTSRLNLHIKQKYPAGADLIEVVCMNLPLSIQFKEG